MAIIIDGKKLAQEIITKLDGGKSWDDVIEEYKDKIVNCLKDEAND
mgnify:CR=1 FL=1